MGKLPIYEQPRPAVAQWGLWDEALAVDEEHRRGVVCCAK